MATTVLCPMEKPDILEQYKKMVITDEEIKKNAEYLKKWLLEQKHLPQTYNYNFLENFLSRCGNDLEMCKQKLDIYFTYKQIYPEYLMPEDPKNQEFRQFVTSVFSLYMPKLTKEGTRIFIDKVTPDEKLFDVSKIMKYFCMQTEIRLIEDKYDAGDVILFDCNNIAFKDILIFIPFFIKSLSLVLEVFPLRIKLLVLVNTGSFMATSINLFKLLLTENARNKLFAYSGDHKHFLNHVNLDVLPKDYGGLQPSLTKLRDEWLEKIDSYRNWFVDQHTTIKSSLSTYMNYKMENSFGAGGSFRNLSID